MASCTVNVKELAQKGEGMDFHLGDEFFGQFDNDELTGGSVDVTVTSQKADGAEYDFTVCFEARGVVRTPCTRCLDDMDYAVEVDDRVKVLCTNVHENSDDENMQEAKADGTLDLSHRVFETIALSLPSVHVHPEGECNPAMIEWLENHSAENMEK